jgi:hypothetical protein
MARPVQAPRDLQRVPRQRVRKPDIGRNQDFQVLALSLARSVERSYISGIEKRRDEVIMIEIKANDGRLHADPTQRLRELP